MAPPFFTASLSSASAAVAARRARTDLIMMAMATAFGRPRQ